VDLPFDGFALDLDRSRPLIVLTLASSNAV
jgi:hypothetical protein